MRNSFFSRKNDAAATTCAAGFACSDVNTNSALLLTIDTVAAVSIFCYTQHSGHYAANRTRQTGIRGITRQHLVYQESAPTVLVGADFFV